MPETIDQAERWDAMVRQYEQAGFCRACSGQAAYGHSLGFPAVRAVCPDCRGRRTPLLDLPGGRRRPANAAVWASGGIA